MGRPAGFWFGTAETRRIADRPPPLAPTSHRPPPPVPNGSPTDRPSPASCSFRLATAFHYR
ncbi:hypothetical protein FIC87_04520 [Eggerthella lenta]|uniref:Uncharacterized protein n=1 Tax=Eggerthella lenta TaxID=84112 RepID=A0A5C5C303_EGGLN|nr:hypothetical protein FIC87_04520 [Eggerthella lenta]